MVGKNIVLYIFRDLADIDSLLSLLIRYTLEVKLNHDRVYLIEYFVTGLRVDVCFVDLKKTISQVFSFFVLQILVNVLNQAVNACKSSRTHL